MSKIKYMPTNTTNDKQELYQHILNTMPVADFNTLPQYLGVTARMTTIRLKDPKKMEFKMIQLLATKMKVSSKFLVEEFNVGKDVLTEIERNYLKTMPVSKSILESNTESNKLPITD